MLTFSLSHQRIPGKATEVDFSRFQTPLEFHIMHSDCTEISGCILVLVVIHCILFMCIHIIICIYSINMHYLQVIICILLIIYLYRSCIHCYEIFILWLLQSLMEIQNSAVCTIFNWASERRVFRLQENGSLLCLISNSTMNFANLTVSAYVSSSAVSTLFLISYIFSSFRHFFLSL